jgi:HlyD family secretion protein
MDQTSPDSLKSRLKAWRGWNWRDTPWRKKIWIPIAAVIIVAVVGFFIYQQITSRQAASAQAPTLQTAVARRGDLTVFATGAGNLIPASEIGFGFDQSGTLSELLVQVGDQVTTGQVLARMTSGETQESIDAEAASAELAVLQAQQSVDDLHNNADLNAAQALSDVEQAQQALDDLKNMSLTQAQAQEAVATAQQQVQDAQTAYDRTHLAASQATIDSAYAAMVLAKQRYDNALTNFERYVNKPEDNLQRAQAQSQLSSAEQSYNTAVANYNGALSTANASEQALAEAQLAAAKAQLDQAQRDYERVKNGPTPGELALAEAQLKNAQLAYDKVKDGPDPQSVAMADAQLKNAQAQLELARQKKVTEDLVAPIDGTVLSIAANVGETVGAATLVTMADLNHPQLQINLDETDMDKVAVGNEVDITFDALPDQAYTGHVIQVNPSLVTVANVKTLQALVQLDLNPDTDPKSLPLGLTATADVISGRAQNAVLVPVEALRQIDKDQYAVFVMENGEPVLHQVTVGLTDFTSAVIESGLQAGDVVTTGVVATNSGGAGNSGN